MSDVQEIFDTRNRISKAWLDKVLRPIFFVSGPGTYQCTEGCRQTQQRGTQQLSQVGLRHIISPFLE